MLHGSERATGRSARRRVPRPSPAMVVALLALFVALGGGAYAAATIASRHLVNNTVRTQDVRNNSLRGKDVRNRGLRGRDIAFDSVTGNQIDEPSLERVPRA